MTDSNYCATFDKDHCDTDTLVCKWDSDSSKCTAPGGKLRTCNQVLNSKPALPPAWQNPACYNLGACGLLTSQYGGDQCVEVDECFFLFDEHKCTDSPQCHWDTFDKANLQPFQGPAYGPSGVCHSKMRYCLGKFKRQTCENSLICAWDAHHDPLWDQDGRCIVKTGTPRDCSEIDTQDGCDSCEDTLGLCQKTSTGTCAPVDSEL